ncbi:linear amide C-N hydrolase [Kitasatospora sp. NPDC057692]|uniref:linear amide C-N hydrolase n=1 Tax=Kitasatospora sp. NPDC057692 TaxID=3346215 RepID=UPI003686317E
MCTRILWRPDGRVLTGRNMDWKQSFHTNLWALPRGVRRTGAGVGDPHPLHWTSRHGSVVATAYDTATTDGVNEKGLAGHVLWLAESDFGERDTTLPGLSASLWLQYHLDSFATVAEALAAPPHQVLGQGDPYSHTFSTIHLALEDATGDSAVIEYLDGKARVHHGPEYTVVTNSPTYDRQLAHLRQFQGLGGDRPLPGTTAPEDRFARAAYYTRRLPEPVDDAQAYAFLLSVMRNTAQPAGTPDPERPNISMTLWRTLTDLRAGVYAFESSFTPNIVWTTLADLDFTTTSKLDLTRPARDLVGDVTELFEGTVPFTFATT